MPYKTVNGVKLYYELDGPPDGEVVVCIHGLATPMNAWPTDLISEIGKAGYRVLRFDNRDVGKSQELKKLGRPSLLKMLLLHSFGFKPKAPYSLQDMAEDALGLAHELEIERFHVIGASMGGMIAQHIAADAPEKVTSLTSIMSSSGAPKLPQAEKHVLDILYSAPSPEDKTKSLEHSIKFWEAIGSKSYPQSKAALRQFLSELSSWGHVNKFGDIRHFAAILADQKRYEKLTNIIAPTLVVHGTEDSLVPPSCGQDTASRIQGARFSLVEGMGHDFPEPLCPGISKDITSHLQANSVRQQLILEGVK